MIWWMFKVSKSIYIVRCKKYLFGEMLGQRAFKLLKYCLVFTQ